MAEGELTIATVSDDEAGQVQTALAFNTELTAANPKVLLNHIATTKGNQVDVMIEDIQVLPDFNVRIKNDGYRAHIRNLADSMKEEGFYPDKPISGFGAMVNGKPVIYIADGHCRLEAVKLAVAEGAEIECIPVVLKDKSTSMEDLTVGLVRTSQGLRLTPIEIAIVCKRLTKFGWKPQQIATKIGVSSEYVSQLLLLAGSPSTVREMVHSGEATAAVAIQAIRQHGEKAGEVMTAALETAKASGKSKVTAKALPQQAAKKVFAKVAPTMFTVIQRVKGHEAFATLPDDLREMIEDIIGRVPPADEESSSAPAAT